MAIPDGRMEYYARQLVLRDIGYEGQLKLRGAKALVVGLGGLGSVASIQLAAMGIGALRLVDRDVVDLSNLHRQILYDASSLGVPKVEAAAKRLRSMNPDPELEPIPISVNPRTAEELVKGVDVVVDGLDRIGPRYAVNRACVKLRVPYVFGAAIEAFGDASTIIPGSTPCLECLYPDLRDDTLPTCGVVGVHPSVVAIIASVEVSEAVRIVLGKPPHLAGRLLYCDLRSFSFDTFAVDRSEDCPVCGSKPSRSPRPLRQELVEELCGRGGRRAFVVNPRESLDLPLEQLRSILRESGWEVAVNTSLGLSFSNGQGVSASLLRSGTMVLEGPETPSKAVAVYRELVTKSLGVPWERVAEPGAEDELSG